MNIQAQMFKMFNEVKSLSEQWSLKFQDSEVQDDTKYYNAPFYSGAYLFGKLLIKCYNGEFKDDKDVEFWMNKFKNLEESVN